jgi:TPP-dependent 2-oxoacid decarboxylase
MAAATEAAQALENLGTANDLNGAAEAYARLEQALGRLQPALAELVMVRGAH